jgi:hypothetical protein
VTVTFVPVSQELLDDVGAPRFIERYVQRHLARVFIAAMFGEEWSSAAAELERVELGRSIRWDSRVWDDEEDEW